MTERPWSQMSSLDLLRLHTRLQPGPQLTVVNFSFWGFEYILTIWLCCLTFWKWISTIQRVTWFLSQGCKELLCLFMDFSLWPLFLSCKWSWLIFLFVCQLLVCKVVIFFAFILSVCQMGNTCMCVWCMLIVLIAD